MLQTLRRLTSRVKRRLPYAGFLFAENLQKPLLFVIGFIAVILVLLHIAYGYIVILLAAAILMARIVIRRVRRTMAKRRLIK